MLQWAREQGCPWDEETCAGAASGGHLKVLQWLREQGCPWDKEECLYIAHMRKRDTMANWIRIQIEDQDSDSFSDYYESDYYESDYSDSE